MNQDTDHPERRMTDAEYELKRLKRKLEIASQYYQSDPTEQNLADLIAAEAELNIAKRESNPLAMYL